MSYISFESDHTAHFTGCGCRRNYDAARSMETQTHPASLHTGSVTGSPLNRGRTGGNTHDGGGKS